ncbi:MAG: 1,4-dihydroxy-2-naphthoate octaprenyltransferase, partial [Candidatus Tectomicrobia bacterium]
MPLNLRPRPWIHAVRPRTLTISVAPVLAGTALAALDVQVLRLSVFAAALLAAVMIQAGTNLHNDVADYERGGDDPATRLGPPRATAEGWLTAGQVRAGAWTCFALALLVGLYLVILGGWPILLVGLVCIGAGWSYSGGARPVAYSSLGELTVLVFFGLVAVTGSYYLQTDTVTRASLLTGIIIGM